MAVVEEPPAGALNAPPPQEDYWEVQLEEGPHQFPKRDYPTREMVKHEVDYFLRDKIVLPPEKAGGRSLHRDSDAAIEMRQQMEVGPESYSQYAELLSGEDAEGNPVEVKPEQITPQALQGVIEAWTKQADEIEKKGVEIRSANKPVKAEAERLESQRTSLEQELGEAERDLDLTNEQEVDEFNRKVKGYNSHLERMRAQHELVSQLPGEHNPTALRQFREQIAAMKRDLDRPWSNETSSEYKTRKGFEDASPTPSARARDRGIEESRPSGALIKSIRERASGGSGRIDPSTAENLGLGLITGLDLDSYSAKQLIAKASPSLPDDADAVKHVQKLDKLYRIARSDLLEQFSDVALRAKVPKEDRALYLSVLQDLAEHHAPQLGVLGKVATRFTRGVEGSFAGMERSLVEFLPGERGERAASGHRWLQQRQQIKRGELPASSKNPLLRGLFAASEMAPAMIGSAKTFKGMKKLLGAKGALVGQTAFWTSQEFPGLLDELKTAGASETQAKIIALPASAVIGAIELIEGPWKALGLSQITKKGVRQTAKKSIVEFFKSYGKEFGEETLQAGVGYVAKEVNAYVGENISIDRRAEWESIKSGLADAALALPWMMGPGHAARHLAQPPLTRTKPEVSESDERATLLTDLKAARAKGTISRKVAKKLGLEGDTIEERTANADEAIKYLEEEAQGAVPEPKTTEVPPSETSEVSEEVGPKVRDKGKEGEVPVEEDQDSDWSDYFGYQTYTREELEQEVETEGIFRKRETDRPTLFLKQLAKHHGILNWDTATREQLIEDILSRQEEREQDIKNIVSPQNQTSVEPTTKVPPTPKVPVEDTAAPTPPPAPATAESPVKPAAAPKTPQKAAQKPAEETPPKQSRGTRFYADATDAEMQEVASMMGIEETDRDKIIDAIENNPKAMAFIEENLPEGESQFTTEKPSQKMTRDQLKKDLETAFVAEPGAVEVTEIPEGFEVTLPNGRKFKALYQTSGIKVDAKAAAKAYGKSEQEIQRILDEGGGAAGTVSGPNTQVELDDGTVLTIEGVTALFDPDRANDTTAKHEALHIAKRLGFFDSADGKRIWDSLVKEHGSEEGIAAAREAWHGPEGLWEKIRDFINQVLEPIRRALGAGASPQGAMTETFKEGFWGQEIKEASTGSEVARSISGSGGVTGQLQSTSPHDANQLGQEEFVSEDLKPGRKIGPQTQIGDLSYQIIRRKWDKFDQDRPEAGSVNNRLRLELEVHESLFGEFKPAKNLLARVLKGKRRPERSAFVEGSVQRHLSPCKAG